MRSCIISAFLPARDDRELEKEVYAILFGAIWLGYDGHSVIMFGGCLVTYPLLVMLSNQKLHFQTLISSEETLSYLGWQLKEKLA